MKSSIQELSSAGKTRKEAAEILGISYASVVQSGVIFTHASKRTAITPREEAMAAMYRGGKTLEDIGSAFGVSRERVRQLLKKFCGMTALDGGQCVSTKIRLAKAAAKRDAASLRKHGCTYDQYRQLVAIGADQKQTDGRTHNTTPTGAYASQKRNALSRGIDWNITLWDWWQVWLQSGKWEMRGRGKDCYVMCRFRDEGGYEVGNVYIATQSHNASFQPNNPYRSSHPDHQKVLAEVRERRERRALPRKKAKNSDLPLGVTRHQGRFMAQISIAGKCRYLGRFDTAQEAHAAYLRAAAAANIRVAA